jgi:hypothetical protein
MTEPYTCGAMKTNCLYFLCLLTLASCGGQVAEDDRERASDWSAQITLELSLSEEVGEPAVMNVSSWSCDQDLTQLSEQLFDLAFNGSALVYAPTLFGEIDRDKPLKPKDLVEELQLFDSVTVEDVVTGEFKDTVIDLSFDKEALTAMSFQLKARFHQNALLLYLSEIGFGRQVFHEETGDRRGVHFKFYMMNSAADESNWSAHDRLMFYSDSLGHMVPNELSYFTVGDEKTLADALRAHFPAASHFRLTFKLSLDSLDGGFYLEDVEVIVTEEPA